MNYTTNYQLPQWVKEDRILMEDFNHMAAKVDEALGEHEEKLVGVGNCIVKLGTYTGRDVYGVGNPTTLSFDHKPVLIVIMPQTISSSAGNRMLLLQGVPGAYSYAEYGNSFCFVSWSGNSVSWYNNSNQDYQYNGRGTYYYAAFLLAEE